MSRQARRILIPILVGLVAFGVLAAVFNGARRQTGNSSPAANPTTNTSTAPSALASATNSAATQSQTPAPGAPGTPGTAPGITTAPAAATTTTAALAAGHLRAVPPEGASDSRTAPPQSLGSLDPTRGDYMRLDFTRQGAGIAAIPFSDIWQTAEAKVKAEAYRKSVLAAGAAFDPNKLDPTQRYVLQTQLPFIWNGPPIQIPIFAARSVVIDGTRVDLLLESAWAQTAPGQFETHIVDGDGNTILEITRRFILGAAYDITLQQRVRNVAGAAVEIKWEQYGPVDLRFDLSGYIDRRRFVFGYLPQPKTQPNYVLSDESDLTYERTAALKQYNKALSAADPKTKHQLLTLWPNSTTTSKGYGVSWFASTNRYFGLAVHPPLGAAGNAAFSLDNVIQEVRIDVSAPSAPADATVFTFLISPAVTIAPQAEASFDMGIYAGPLDRHVLGKDPYRQLAMQEMIIYQMSSCCSFLTFQWLAKLLLGFLSLLHDYVLFDWGLAIIALVVVVRALLHPLTKRSQVSMQRFSKSMAAMKPEMDKVKNKFPNDPKKVQQEQMRLMREHGTNPLQMLGCLPLFLQTPIWIALWAMLYLAFDLRQQPAFYGVFQLFNNWPFLGDLSSQDRFIPLSGAGFTIPLVGWQVTSINLLPLLMGVVFFIQQKYLSPPPTPNMTPEQIQQQRIMKVMTVVMMPLFLYKAPCGLTLYMTTSSCIGILESRYIRRHINEMDLNPPKPREKGAKKIKDPRGRAFAEAIERARAKRSAEPPRSFKKRK